ncbi:MAG TPA: hypothetical protein EYN91_20930 [Candidatus Melainabacteria bacterium]|jgi:hypothetical protein|nr:hypothetical protein [Candidatus Melainabacteria bacterium]HIN65971.1 hypothetical protein [Candidatus Obscuribacterales bacterium]
MLKANEYPAYAFSAAAALILTYSPSAKAFDNSFGQTTLPVHSPVKMTQLESESGGVFFGGGESESGGVYGGEQETESGGPTDQGNETETGGARNAGSSSEAGGPGNSAAESESGGASNAGNESESGGPGVEIRNY